jgi:hypothetical protein
MTTFKQTSVLEYDPKLRVYRDKAKRFYLVWEGRIDGSLILRKEQIEPFLATRLIKDGIEYSNFCDD